MSDSVAPCGDLDLRGSTACAAPADRTFADAWEKHSPELQRCCRVWMGSYQADADEAFSRASFRIYRELPRRYSKVENLRAWLLRLTYNVCMDLYRNRQRRREEIVELDSIPPEPGEMMPQLSPLAADPERSYLQKELLELMSRAVDDLPERLRQTVRCYLASDSYRETADRLAINEANARKRMQEARAILRRRRSDYLAGIAGGPKPGRPDPGLPTARPKGQVPDLLSAVSETVAPTWRVFAVTRPPSAEQPQSVLFLGVAPRKPSRRRRQALRRYIDRYPTGWTKRLELGAQLRHEGRLEEAIPHLEVAVEKQPRRCEPWLELAAVHLLQGRPVTAAAIYQQGIGSVSGAAAHFLRGLMERCRGRLKQATQAFEAARQASPESPVPLIALADLWLSAGCPTEAVLALDVALAVEPDNMVALTLGHQELRLAGRSFEAESRAARAFDLDRSNRVARVLWFEARCRATSGRFAAGSIERRQLNKLRRMASTQADACRCYALWLFYRGDLAEAEHQLARLVGERPGERQGWVEYARLLDRLGKTEQAVKAIDQACTLRPPNRNLELLRCRLWTRAGLGRRVRCQIEDLLNRHGDAWDVTSTAAWALSTLGLEPERALALSQTASDLQPNLAAAWFEHGRVLASWDRPREAAAALEKAWKLLSDDDGPDLARPAALDFAAVQRRSNNLDSQWPETS